MPSPDFKWEKLLLLLVSLHSCNTLVDALQKSHVWEFCICTTFRIEKERHFYPCCPSYADQRKQNRCCSCLLLFSLLSIFLSHPLVLPSLLIYLIGICSPHLNLFFQVVLATVVKKKKLCLPLLVAVQQNYLFILLRHLRTHTCSKKLLDVRSSGSLRCWDTRKPLKQMHYFCICFRFWFKFCCCCLELLTW